MENKIIQWKAHEFVEYEKGFGWYFTFLVITLLILGYELVIHDYFAFITFVIIAIVVYFFSKQKPQEVDIYITDKAIQIGDFSLPYHNIIRFWIVDHEHSKALHLETTAYLNRFITIQLNGQDPDEVRNVLNEFLLESQPNYETFAHRISRKLKF